MIGFVLLGIIWGSLILLGVAARAARRKRLKQQEDLTRRAMRDALREVLAERDKTGRGL